MDDIANNSGQLKPTALPQASDEKLVAGLENLLEKQLKLMHSSRDKAVVDLASQTSDVVNIIGQKEILKDDKFITQRKNIERLFKELTLAAAERKLSVTSELRKIRKGKRTVGAYKKEILPTHSNLL
jgi:hypothetical protein